MKNLLDGKTNQWWKKKSKYWTAGSNLKEAVDCINDYNQKGFGVIINSIASVSTNKKEIEQIKNNYISLIKTLEKNSLQAGITVRSSNLGVGFSYSLAKDALLEIMGVAKKLNVSIEMDTEERPYVEKNFKLASDMIEAGFVLRLCLQSGIKNIYKLTEDLIDNYDKKISFRIVTGSCYKESCEISAPESIRTFYKLMTLVGQNSAVGTHIPERLLAANGMGIETQVLMGFENDLPKGSVDTIYACFGDWKTNDGIRGYILRREVPA